MSHSRGCGPNPVAGAFSAWPLPTHLQAKQTSGYDEENEDEDDDDDDDECRRLITPPEKRTATARGLAQELKMGGRMGDYHDDDDGNHTTRCSAS